MSADLTHSHDLSPSAVFGQVILPKKGRYLVLALLGLVVVSAAATGIYGAKALVVRRQLAQAEELAQELQGKRDELEALGRTRSASHRRASQTAAWVRRNLAMQPFALAVLEAVPPGVTLSRIEVELAEGGAPQFRLRVSVKGDAEAGERALGAIARALFRYGLRIVDEPVPERTALGFGATFAVQFPPIDELELREGKL